MHPFRVFVRRSSEWVAQRVEAQTGVFAFIALACVAIVGLDVLHLYDQRSHAIANGVYVASVNRVGHEFGDIRGNRAPGVGLEFWGGSFIADPFGRILAQAPHDSEAILIEEVDLKHLEDTRRNWPFLRDRRIDFYPPITARFLDDGK